MIMDLCICPLNSNFCFWYLDCFMPSWWNDHLLMKNYYSSTLSFSFLTWSLSCMMVWKHQLPFAGLFQTSFFLLHFWSLKHIMCKQHVVESCFFVYPCNLFPFQWISCLFTLNVIIDLVESKSFILLVVFYCPCLFSPHILPLFFVLFNKTFLALHFI